MPSRPESEGQEGRAEISTEVVQTTDDSVEDVPSQMIVTTASATPSTSFTRRASRNDDDSHLKRRASEEGNKRPMEENKRPRLDMKDGELKRRGQRMFGMILGTLTKFKNESQNKSEAEIKREQIDQKLQEKLKKEKDELLEKMKQEDQEKRERIARQRKEEEDKRKAELRECWTNQQKNLANYLCTTTEPRLHYLPARLSSKDVETIAEQKRKLALASASAMHHSDKTSKTPSKNDNEDDVDMEDISKDEGKVKVVDNEVRDYAEARDENIMEVDQSGENSKNYTGERGSNPVVEVTAGDGRIISSNPTDDAIDRTSMTTAAVTIDNPAMSSTPEPTIKEDIAMKEGEPDEVVEY